MVDNIDDNNNASCSVPTNTRDKELLSTADEEIDKLLSYNEMQVNPKYKGPHITIPITLPVLCELVDFFKAGQILDGKYVLLILHETILRMKTLPNISEVNINIWKQITIVGDLHGKFQDLCTIFYKNGLPSAENPYIFNGDLVDRGHTSVEVLITLCCFYLLYPEHVFINRGNHEDFVMNSRYGFVKEISEKYQRAAKKINNSCRILFGWLPLATLINKRIFVVHGGISDRTDLEELTKVRRNQFQSILKPSHVSLDDESSMNIETILEWGQILDIMWSDPQPQNGKKFNNYRGGGCFFGPDVTNDILSKHGWDMIIRSHECKFEGYEYTHNDKILTIFSISSYYTKDSNLGAYIKLCSLDQKPKIVQFKSNKDHVTSLTNRVSANEESAMKELREKIYSHHKELMEEFLKYDPDNQGRITVSDWSISLENVLQLKLPWVMLRSKLVQSNDSQHVLYATCLNGYKIQSSLPQLNSLSETIYRHRQSLETVFRMIDKDCSGLISSEEFEEACHMLNKYSSTHIIPSTSIKDLAKTLDINKDGMIDFNEFLEAFRLVTISVQENQKDID